MGPTSFFGRFNALFRCRLCWRVTFAVFAAIFLIEAAILVPSYHNQEHNLLNRLNQVGRTMVISASYYFLSHASKEFVALLDEVTQGTELAGGAVYDADGELVGTFGEPPSQRLGKLLAADEARIIEDRYEIVWQPHETGLTVTVVGRMDASAIPDALSDFVWRIAGLVLLISGFVCIVTMVILDRIVLGPMLGIRANLVAAQREPQYADRHIMSHRRNDEMGEVVEALNSLLMRVSKTYREDLAAMVAMADNSNEGIIAYDRSWNLVYANGACLDFCKVATKQEMAQNDLPRFGLADRPGNFTLAELAGGGGFSGEATLFGAGTRIPCYVNAGEIFDDGGAVLRYHATITDVTEISDARISLERQNLELETSNRAKDQFVANMSHELRTPLNAILGFSEMMRTETFGPLGAPQYKEYLDDINNRGKHLLEIINNILDLSKIEAGRFELKEEEVDPSDTIESSIRLIREQARGHNIEIGTQVPADLPKLWVDGQKVKQMLINLLSNAVKFTPEGGHITISARTETDGHLAISIADDGIGIADADQEKVFRPFGQADAGLNRKFEGTGLGLPLAKAMVELHSGRLELDSRLDHGTTVTLHFPSSRLVA